MPTSPDGILQATFDPAWAAVRLIVDGGMWPSAVASITIVRQQAGVADIPVRGVQNEAVVGGYFVGSDIDMDLETLITYAITGYSSAGAVVKTTSVAVSTSGSEPGIWVKVPGLPDMTVHAGLRPVSGVTSDTVGGVYQIIGGSSVVQTTAQWSGVDTDKATVTLVVDAGIATTRLRAALNAGRVLLLQPVGSSGIDAGWYFISTVSRANPGGFEDYSQREFTLQVQRTGVPAGDGQGIPGTTWATVLDTYATWQDVIDANDTWFDLLQGV